MKEIKITSVGIEKTIKKFDMLSSICEYVWNGFDAKANNISIIVDVEDIFNKILKIEIHDDGTGICYETLDNTFSPFLSSDKSNMNDSSISTFHGKNGIGRLTYVNYAENIKWITTYLKEDKLYNYMITSTKKTINNYEVSDVKNSDEINTGTTVVIENIFYEEYLDNLIEKLINEFAWYLILNPEYSIKVNGNLLDIQSLIGKNLVARFDEYDGFDINLILWNKKINEYSKIYYINSDNQEVYKENTTFNNKGDSFYHSIYLKSPIFDNFNFNTGQQLDIFCKTKNSEEFIFIHKKILDLLKNTRVEYLKKKAPNFVKNLNIEKAFKHYNKTNSVDVQKKECLSQMLESIYVAQPAVLTNLNEVQSKTLIRLLNLALDSGEVESIFKILDEIVELQPEERKELSRLLELTKLSNIIKTISLISERLKILEDFKQLIFKDELNANEVTHIQTMMENNYWLIGEQYYLFSKSEDTVIKSLKNYANLLHKEYDEITEIRVRDKYKQFDLLLSRSSIGFEKRENVLVELKHPKIKLSDKQFSQICNYMRIIREQPMFNGSNIYWKFYLIGNKVDDYIANLIESAKNHGEESLVQAIDGGKCKIYVKTWSEVFNDYEIKYKTLLETLSVDKDALVEKYKDANDVLEKNGYK